MKKQICRVALALSLFSLAGCGLKGPLYFPPDDQPKPGTVQTDNQGQPPQTNAQGIEQPVAVGVGNGQ